MRRFSPGSRPLTENRRGLLPPEVDGAISPAPFYTMGAEGRDLRGPAKG